MKDWLACVLLGLTLCPTVAGAQATIKELELKNGYDEDNTIASPLFDSTSSPALEVGNFEAAYDTRAKVVRRGGGNFFTRGPEYKLDENIDLAEMLSVALRDESSAMGFRRVPSEGDGWHIAGILSDIYLESRQVPMGATLFYGFMNVELHVRRGTDEPQTVPLRIHNYYAAYNAGMGRRDEARDGLVHLLVEGAQEILSRLNRRYFEASSNIDLNEVVASLGSVSFNDLHRIGLAGPRSTATALLELIPQTDDSSRRSALIDAVGRIGALEAVSILAARYGDEEEDDCRWYTIKALDYIGGEDAMAVIQEHGVDDDHDATERLAKRILQN